MCKERCIMRTNIVLDNEIVEEAFKYSKSKTKKDLIKEALIEFVESKKRKNLLELRGKIKFSENYDYKKYR